MLSFIKKLFSRQPPPVIPAPKPPCYGNRVAQLYVIDPPEQPTIRKGTTNYTEVKIAQRRLKENGFFESEPAGIFGDATERAVLHFQQTHLGPDKKPLRADGIIGPNTWWALYNPSGPGQKQGVMEDLEKKGKHPQDIIPAGISKARREVLEQALLLYLAPTREVPDGSNTGDGVTKFHSWFGMPPAAWCAMCFCWIIAQALGRLPWSGGKQAHVATLWRMLKKQGMAKALASNYKPRPGDGFVMVHPNDTGHIGIIVRVSVNGKHLEVFEGNSGNRFALRRRRVGFDDHIGYINFYDDENNKSAYTQGLTGEASAATSQTR